MVDWLIQDWLMCELFVARLWDVQNENHFSKTVKIIDVSTVHRYTEPREEKIVVELIGVV